MLMQQIDLVLEQVAKKYRLELKCMELQAQNTAFLKQIPQALHKQRNAEEKLRRYENGSLRAFFHKVSGNFESQLEEYRRDARYASSELEQLQRQQQSAEDEITRLQGELAELSGCEVQCETLLKTDFPEQQQVQKRYKIISAVFHGKMAVFHLEGNKEYLLMARATKGKMAQADRLQIVYERDRTLEQADRCANACAAHIQELNHCLSAMEKEQIQLGEYFTSPTSYIVGAVSEWSWLDRINCALEQIAEVKEALQQILDLFEETP